MASAVVRAKPFRQLAMFFNRTAPIWSVVRSLTDGMGDEKINYAMVGGLALYAHGYHRMTIDIDIFLAKSVRKLGQFKDVFFGSFWIFFLLGLRKVREQICRPESPTTIRTSEEEIQLDQYRGVFSLSLWSIRVTANQVQLLFWILRRVTK